MGRDDAEVFEGKSGTSSRDLRPGDGRAEEPLREAAKQTRKIVWDITQQIKAHGRAILTDRKDQIASQLNSFATVLRQTVGRLRDENQTSVAELTETSAEKVERLSGYLREKDLNDMVNEAEDFARRRPAVFIGGALAAGFLLGQLLKGWDRSTEEPSVSKAEARPSLEYSFDEGEESYHGPH